MPEAFSIQDDTMPLLSDSTPKANKKRVYGFAIMTLVLILVVIAVIMTSTQSTEGCFYWGEHTVGGEIFYCPGDCIFQNGDTYCPDGDQERVMLSYVFDQYDASICNDGTKPIHYHRPSLPGPHEDQWVLRFEGGNACFSPSTCDDRQNSEEWTFMTTAATPLIYEDPENGIFNGSPDKNPHWHDYNVISSHYCTSDAWSGTNAAEDNEIGIHFKGHENVIGVFVEALNVWNMSSASRVIVFGFSAGGIGMMSGSETTVEWFNENAPDVELFFLMDSSWFLESEPTWGEMECEVQSDCDLQTQMIYALEYWEPVYSENCANAGLDWECMIPEYSFYYQTTNAQFFILQNYYDAMQVNLHTSDNAAITVGDHPDWFYLFQANITLMTLQEHMSGFFISNCENHDNLNRNWMYEIWVNDTQQTQEIWRYYDIVQPDGRKIWIYEDYMDEDGAPCLACNPTCPYYYSPPHTHELEAGGGRR